MSWARFRLRGGLVKVKPFWQMRSFERERRIPMLNLGLVVISWWSDKTQADYENR